MSGGNEGRAGVREVSRRAALGGLGAAAVAYAVFGPRGARDVPPGRVVIDYWEKWTGQEGRAMQSIVDEFNATHDRIFVRYFSMSTIEQKAMVSIAGGDPPDVLGLWSFATPTFAESAGLLAIDDLDASFGAEIAADFRSRYGDTRWVFEPERYTKPAWDFCRYKGLSWGAVSTCSSMALYYNRGLFREVGLDPDRPPRTIDEMDEAAERLTSFGGDGRVERAGFVHREPGWWDWIWGYFFGGTLLSDDGRRALAGSAENVRGFEWLQSYPERIGRTRLLAFQSGFGNYNSLQQPFLAGQVGMVLHGPFLANVIELFRPDLDYAAVPFPVEASIYDPAAPIALLEADTLCIPRGCKHPREAFEFVAFVQRGEILERLARAHAKPSPLAEVSESFVRTHSNRSIAMHNGLMGSPRAFVKPQTRVWPQYESEFIAGMGAMWDLRVGAGEELLGIEARAQVLLDDAALRHERRYGVRTLAERRPRAGSGA